MIHVLVKVTYDYYRFQENLAASTDYDRLMVIAEHESETHRIPLILYEAGSPEHRSVEKNDRDHLWIESFRDSTSAAQRTSQ